MNWHLEGVHIQAEAAAQFFYQDCETPMKNIKRPGNLSAVQKKKGFGLDDL